MRGFTNLEASNTQTMDLYKLIQKKDCSIVDVRTRAEYSGGHAEGSVNIPLQELQQRFEEFTTMKGPVVLCCASGGRSGQATVWLMSKGIECVNGGSWLDINYVQSQVAAE